MAKGKLLALFAVFAAIGLVTATGAFTTVSAERTAEVGVAGDDSALLALEPATSGQNAQGTPVAGNNPYVETNNGQLQLNLEEVNLDATTSVESVFTITNQGTQAATVSIGASGANDGAIDFAVMSSELQDTNGNQVSDDDTFTSENEVSLSSNSVELDPGESVTVGIYIDTSDNNPSNGLNTGASSSVGQGEEIINSVTINADADGSPDYEVPDNSN